MPSIPRFHVTQTDAKVLIHISVPYVRVSDMEFHVDGVHFSFYCKPYLLKLKLPHAVLDNEFTKAQYDPNLNHGTIVVHLPKETPGQHFEDLDLLTKLLLPRAKAAASDPLHVRASAAKSAPLIEVMHMTTTTPTTTTTTTTTTGRAHATSEASSGKQQHDVLRQTAMGEQSAVQPLGSADASLLALEQQLQETHLHEDNSAAAIINLHEDDLTANKDQVKVHVTGLQPTYGFNNRHCDFFRCWHGEISEIIALPCPDNTSAAQRRILREQAEETHFDVERYLLDFAHAHQDSYYQAAMEFEPFWRRSRSPTTGSSARTSSLIAVVASTNHDTNALCDEVASLSINSSESESSTIFSEADRELLLRFPHKEYLIGSSSDEANLLLGGLVDILVGFVYDHLVTQGDAGVESAWTLTTISPTLSWLDSCGQLSSVVRTSMRRMVTYPFLRQSLLALHVLDETLALVQSGRRMVLKALLEVYRILEKSETQYLLNALYIEDYCIWLQTIEENTLVGLAKKLETALGSFDKDQTGWALSEMEQLVLEVDHDLADDESVSGDGEDESESDSDSSDDDDDNDDDDDDDGDDDGDDDDEEEEKEKEESDREVTSGDDSRSTSASCPPATDSCSSARPPPAPQS